MSGGFTLPEPSEYGSRGVIRHGEVPMNENKFLAICFVSFLVFWLIAAFLFAGEPDVTDAIRQWIHADAPARAPEKV